MPLIAGARLGPYEIVAAIGAGGMGEVYRARDTKLDRDVAIKVLPEAFVADPERVARFQREAKTLASLNHPNIAIIHGLEHQERLRPRRAEDEQVRGEVSASARAGGGAPAPVEEVGLFLVMELVEGEDLSQRIEGQRAKGSGLPIDEALPIAKQIAEALEAAHEQGIIHRDLKPANIKVRPDGTVKVLDFGLAKAIEEAGGAGRAGGAGAASASMSPTITTPAMTMAGVILGTAAYMSPEQAKGRAADKRSDVWAFGCVLFEMLAGKRAFEGDDVSDTLAVVLRGSPDWDALPATTPAPIVKLVRGCLQKDRKERVPDIAVARLEIKEALTAPADSGRAATRSQPAPAPRPLWKRAIPVAVTAVLAGAMVGATAWELRPARPPAAVTRFALTLAEGQTFTANATLSVAVSPDGTRLVYAANNQLYLRSMSELEARPIPGTSQTPSPGSPVFSPDGQSIVFFSQVDRAIKKIAVSGGAAVTICPAETPFLGMSWDTSGILFGQARKGILRVSANGGQPETLVKVKDGEFLHGPQLLPGGEWVLFTSATATTSEGWDKAQIVVQSLKSTERKILVAGGSDGRYVPTGHIVYALGGVLFAIPFNLGHQAVMGGPVPVLEGVRRSNTGSTGITHLAISGNGTLAFTPGPTSTSSAQADLALIDRNGTVQPLKFPPGAYEYPRVSPNGKHIAFDSDDGKDAIVWIYDVAGTSSIRRLTLGGRNRVPVWSADSEHVAFQSDREGDLAIWWQRADGTTPAERLTKPDKDTAHVPESWSPDGKTLLLGAARGGNSYSLMALAIEDKKVAPFGGVVETLFPPTAAFSPDGKWVAYSAGLTTPSGTVFVQPFPPTGATYPISKNGIHPAWSPDGKELLYGPAAGSAAAVSVTTRPSFSFGNPVITPRVFIERGPTVERTYDVMPDGRFLAVVAAGQNSTTGAPSAPQIQVVLNWFEELKTRVPAGK
jgi:serine/threonine-protein kinase